MLSTFSSGVYTALCTPFLSSGEIDFLSFEKLLETQFRASVSGVILSGTTGESPTLSTEEKFLLLKKAKQIRQNLSTKTLLLLGTGTNSTSSTLELTKKAILEQADGALVVTPYYNRPSQEGLFSHYKAIDEIVQKNSVSGFPVMVYHIPGRTGVTIEPPTAEKVFSLPSMQGWKESTGNAENFSKLLELKKTLGYEKKVFSGDDSTFYDWSLRGGDGVVSVASHLLGKAMTQAWESFQATQNSDALLSIHKKHQSLFKNLFLESNPSPLKYLLKKSGQISSDHVRLPLVACTEKTKIILDQESSYEA